MIKRLQTHAVLLSAIMVTVIGCRVRPVRPIPPSPQEAKTLMTAMGKLNTCLMLATVPIVQPTDALLLTKEGVSAAMQSTEQKLRLINAVRPTSEHLASATSSLTKYINNPTPEGWQQTWDQMTSLCSQATSLTHATPWKELVAAPQRDTFKGELDRFDALMSGLGKASSIRAAEERPTD